MANFSHVAFVVSINNQKENKMKDHVDVYWFLMEIFGSKNAFMSTNWWRKSFRNVDRIPCKKLFCFDWQKAEFQSTCLSSVSVRVSVTTSPLSLKITSTMPSKVIIMKWLSQIHLEAVFLSVFHLAFDFCRQKRAFTRKSNWVIF